MLHPSIAAASALIQTSSQTTWLWIGTIGMTLGAIAIAGIGRSLGREAHHAVTSFFVCAIAACLYLLMALGQGHVVVSHGALSLGSAGIAPGPGTKLVFFARYIDWVLTTPLLLIGLIGVGLGSARGDGRSTSRWTLIGAAVGADVFMILTGLFATLTIDSAHKYAWFGVSCVFFLIVVGLVWGPVRSTAMATGGQTAATYARLLVMLTGLWFLYPIIWLLGTEGSATLGLTTEVAIYAVIDLTAKVGFGLALVTGVKRTETGVEPVRFASGLPASA